MPFKQVFVFVALCLIGIATALPSPHVGMVDTATIRDVGVTYSEANFKGDPSFVFEVKVQSQCLPMETSQMASVQICKEGCYCTFYTGNDCNAGPNNFAVTVSHGDVANVKTPAGNLFKHYMCGTGTPATTNMTLETTPYDPKRDEGLSM